MTRVRSVRPSTSTPARPFWRSIAVLAVAGLAIAACDTGDGTRLAPPVAETTLPPVDTTPLESLPIDQLPIDADSPLPPDIGDLDQILTSDPAPILEQEAGPLQLFAPWADGGPIDPRYTCDGGNATPAISWAGIPEGTPEIAIALVDETTLSNGQPFIHWVIGGIDPSVDRLGENEIPLGALQGLNFFGEIAYTGPCPDPGNTNNYRLTVYALGQQLELADGTPGAEMLDLIDTVTFATASTSGTVTR